MLLLFHVLIVFSFLKPAGFDSYGYGTINSIINCSRIIFAVYIFSEYFKLFYSFSRPIKVVSFFFFLAWVSTIMGDSDVFKFLSFAGSMIALLMYVELMCVKNVRLMILSFFVVYTILMFFNYAWMINQGGFIVDAESVRPDLYLERGGATVTVLSSVNAVASYVFPSLIFAVLLMKITTKRNFFSWTLIAICFFSELFLWSATSLVGVVLSIVYLFFVYEKNIENYISIKVLLYCIMALSLGITFFHIQYLFSFVIEDVLHKDLSMTGRLPQWEYVMNSFFYPSPFWGSGWGTRTSDNCFVQVLCDMGVVGFSYFMFLLKEFFDYVYLNIPSSLGKFVLFIFAVEMLMFSSESWVHFYGFYVTLALLANAETIQRNISTNFLEKKL